MKKLYTNILAILMGLSLFAQSPESFNYQAVIRNTSGVVVVNQKVGLQISILHGSAMGTPVYTETFKPTTNNFGLITLEIGNGTVKNDNFSAIDWSAGPYFVQVELDVAGGTNYVIMGTSQLLSVPYALHAKTSENAFSGNYNDLANAPTTVSSFINDAGYISDFSETDPVFGASPAFGITGGNIANWSVAYGWGNHASAGYLTSFTENDPVFGASPAFGISNVNITNWSDAFSWGNHASAGYLTSFTENDPIFGTSPAFGISNVNITNWSDAFSWGNHASVGYLTSFTENDPVFGASPAFGISNVNITNWSDAFSWGNHASAGYLTSFTENDPVFSNLFSITTPSNNQLLRYNSGISMWENWTPDFLTAEVDGDATNEIQDLSLSNDTLRITSSASAIDLSGYLDNTDSQNLSNVLAQGNSAGNSAITNLADPINAQDAATKAYIDNMLMKIGEISKLIAAGYTIQQLLDNGRTIFELLDGGVTAADLLAAGVDVQDLWDTGVTVSELLAAGVSITAILAAGADISAFYGISHQGGLIFYINPVNGSGLVCAESDQSIAAYWGCYNVNIPGATGTTVGTGQQNTNDIVASSCIDPDDAGVICDNLNLNSYTDWFLPSINELLLMYTNLHLNGFGNFTNVRYWSSSEYNAVTARTVPFVNGASDRYLKNSNLQHVRAIRAFL